MRLEPGVSLEHFQDLTAMIVPRFWSDFTRKLRKGAWCEWLPQNQGDRGGGEVEEAVDKLVDSSARGRGQATRAESETGGSTPAGYGDRSSP